MAPFLQINHTINPNQNWKFPKPNPNTHNHRKTTITPCPQSPKHPLPTNKSLQPVNHLTITIHNQPIPPLFSANSISFPSIIIFPINQHHETIKPPSNPCPLPMASTKHPNLQLTSKQHHHQIHHNPKPASPCLQPIQQTHLSFC